MLRFDPKRLSALREALGCSRAEFARRITKGGGVAVSANTVARWERGETFPDARDLAAICRATGLRKAERFFRDPAPLFGG